MIDLRSDFLSSPSAAMLAAMAEAATGEKGYGPRDDPHQRRLEELAAEMLGKEDALFLPTCMMANLLAVMCAAGRGEAVILDAASHLLNSESGAMAAIAGTLALALPSERGRIPPALIAETLHPGTLQQPRTAMLVLENTHNKAGGIANGADYYAEARAAAGSCWMHLDGSRIFNAAVALGCGARDLVRSFESVAFSLNKGLAAPAGAILAGPASFIGEATRLRQQLGGGWRPVGMLAAAGVVALRTMVGRLADDHARARRIAETLAGCAGVDIDLSSVQTNIVRGRLRHPRLAAEAFRSELETRGIRIQVAADGAFRLVTYHDIDDDLTGEVCATLRGILGPAENSGTKHRGEGR
ncbi:MAG: hypothetical protein KIT81_08430 [Alphaproteobacteria bacterium]|nr:hypothetical protein [Alphaproteobacteria bacterium]